MQNTGFSKVGSTALHRYRFHIGDKVAFPNGDPTTNSGRRIACPACVARPKWLDLSMPLWLFNSLLVLAVFLGLFWLGARMAEAERLQSEAERTLKEAEKITRTIADKKAVYDSLCEENAICIRAVEELGMKRPVNATVIKISAPPTRFSQPVGGAAVSDNEG